MGRILKFVAVAQILTAIASAPFLTSQAALAQASDPAAAQVQGFYDALLISMKSGGSAKSRYDKLKPAVEKAFDLASMTASAAGPTWASMSDADKKTLIDAFARLTIANYAKSFDSYDGEKFIVEPVSLTRGSEHLVKSTMKTHNETIAFNYPVHQVGSDWKITDVYLEGNISQMAQKRSDFSSTITSAGPQALAKRLNALTDQILN